MRADPSLSAIIVNFRTYDELRVCLAAIRRTAGSIPLETLIVDHESDAGRASELRREFPDATVLATDRNPGFAAGVNRGASCAKGRALLLLNPDTVISPTLIPILAGWLDAHADVAAVGPRIFNADGSLQPSARRFPDLTTGLGGRKSWLTRVAPGNWLSRRNLDWSRASEPVAVDWVSGACMMIRRSAFDAVGGMDERFFLYWEDADLCRRLRDAGYRTVFVPTVSAVHESARASRHLAARSLVAFHRSAFRFYWKHSGPMARALAPIVQAALWGRLLLKLAFRKRDAL